jgi:hypothetical protein
MRRKIAQVADGFTPIVERRDSPAPYTVAEGPHTCLGGLVAGQLTVEGLVESTLLGRSKDPVLFHAGHQRSALQTQS